MTTAAAQTLARQLKDLTRQPIPGFRVALIDDNIFKWDIGIIGPPDSIYSGGYFGATMTFPQDYPFSPPAFSFNRDFFHPNVYTDGKVCISILHPPGDDPLSGESAAERWNPTQTVESILLSVISLLSDPNCSSPANVDAGVMWRNDPDKYKAIMKKQIETSKPDVPADLVLPRTMDEFILKPTSRNDSDFEDEDDDFWGYEEDEDDDEEEDYGEDEDEGMEGEDDD